MHCRRATAIGEPAPNQMFTTRSPTTAGRAGRLLVGAPEVVGYGDQFEMYAAVRCCSSPHGVTRRDRS